MKHAEFRLSYGAIADVIQRLYSERMLVVDVIVVPPSMRRDINTLAGRTVSNSFQAGYHVDMLSMPLGPVRIESDDRLVRRAVLYSRALIDHDMAVSAAAYGTLPPHCGAVIEDVKSPFA